MTDNVSNYEQGLKKIHKRPRKRVRDIARFALMVTLDEDAAKQRAEEMIRHEYGSIIGAILIGVMIRLAIELITYWILQGFTGGNLPPEQYQPNEPGYLP